MHCASVKVTTEKAGFTSAIFFSHSMHAPQGFRGFMSLWDSKIDRIGLGQGLRGFMSLWGCKVGLGLGFELGLGRVRVRVMFMTRFIAMDRDRVI